ncbi:hypothetical protein KRR38_28825 [Novosphingobium sp. G106]|uniref:hypothetical protein n=1 Tax=Novosphingobium sp. G106 TaxID=2849500 RepID=UPI001C2D690B|nr:hypothetical protein [Novosphingobium sp. G106]MBV1691573.1 hypothetical protein [Novosphingobium sp. G106]
MPITPITGAFLHADPHTGAALPCEPMKGVLSLTAWLTLIAGAFIALNACAAVSGDGGKSEALREAEKACGFGLRSLVPLSQNEIPEAWRRERKLIVVSLLSHDQKSACLGSFGSDEGYRFVGLVRAPEDPRKK